MSKNAIIFLGTGCKPSDFWYAWVSEQLKARGYEVEIPFYPEINRVAISKFLPKVIKNHRFDEDTVMIGHSAGAPLILSILEKLDTKIRQAILVAGYVQELPADEAQGKDPFIQKSYDWELIRSKCIDLIIINSTNDPWGCDDREGRYMFDRLGGTLIIRNDGHFGSRAHKQQYPEFPLLDKLVA